MNKNYYIAPSEIHGDGLFASVDFKKGGMVGLAHVNDQPVTEIGKFHNHDEKKPTMISKKIGNKRYLYANQDLKAGTELTTNYRMQPELGQPEEFDVPKAQDGIFLSSGKFRPQTNTIGSTLGYTKVFPKRDTTWSLTGNLGYGYNYEADKSGLAASINAENFGKFFNGQRRVNAVTNLEGFVEPGNYGAQISAGPNLHWGTHPKRELSRGRGRLDFQPFNLRLGYQTTAWKDDEGQPIPINVDNGQVSKGKVSWGYGAKLRGEYKPKLKGKFRPTLFGDLGVDADFLMQQYDQDKIDAGSIYGDTEGFKIKPSFSANVGIRVPIDGKRLRRKRKPVVEDDAYYNPGIRTSDPNSVKAYEEPDDYQEGGLILDLNEQEAQRYAEGGYILEELRDGGEDCPDGYVKDLNGDCVKPDYTGSAEENVDLKDELEAQGFKDETHLLKDPPKGLSMFSLKPGQSVEDLLGSLKEHPFAKSDKDKEFIKKNKKDWAAFVDEWRVFQKDMDYPPGIPTSYFNLDRNKPNWNWLRSHDKYKDHLYRNVDWQKFAKENNITRYSTPSQRLNLKWDELTDAGKIVEKYFGDMTRNSDGGSDAMFDKEDELKEYFAKKLGKETWDINGSKLLRATLHDTEKSGKYKPLYVDLQKEYDKMPFNKVEKPEPILEIEKPEVIAQVEEEAIPDKLDKTKLPLIPRPIEKQPLPSPEEFYADSLPVTNSEGEIVLPYEETEGKYRRERRGTRRPGTKDRAWDGGKGFFQRLFTDKRYSGPLFPGLKRNIKQEGGPLVKQRKGFRENYDHSVWTPSGEFSKPSSVSSHLMAAEEVPGRGWVGFPTLFQGNPYVENENMLSTNVGEWLDMSDQNNGWWPIYEEADRRGEVYDFGKDKQAALAFGEGSWKDQLPDEGMEIELTDEEVEQYKAGGYVLEEMHNGGVGSGHPHPETYQERWDREWTQSRDQDNTRHVVNERPLLNLDGSDPDADYNQWIAENIDYGTNPNKSLFTYMAEGIMGIPKLLTKTLPNYIAETAEDAYDEFSKTSFMPSNVEEGLDDIYHLPANLLAKDYSSYSTRDKAFAQARKDGEKDFMYNGKRYNTRREDDDIKLTFETDDPKKQAVFQDLTNETKKDYPILWNLMNKASGIDEISFDGIGSDPPLLTELLYDDLSENRGYFTKGHGFGDKATIHVGEDPFKHGTYDDFINVLIAELAHRTGHTPSNNPLDGFTHTLKSSFENIKYGDKKRYQTPGTDEFNNHRLIEPGIHMTVRGQMTPTIVKKVQNFLGIEEDGIFSEDTYLAMVDRFKDNEIIKETLERYIKENPKDKHPGLPIASGGRY